MKHPRDPNQTIAFEFAAGLTADLEAFRKLCEEILALTMNENLALTGQRDYQMREFSQCRKDLLPNLESALLNLRSRRHLGELTGQLRRVFSDEIRALFQVIQNLLMKVLLLDRENQQAMLRRGMMPVGHLPAVGGQRPGYLASLYQRNSGV